jgi:GT2 family glycosyltransferase
LTAYLRDPGIVPCICGLLARREVVSRVGGFDDSIQDLFEDQVFLYRMILAGPVYVEACCGERYRQHAGSTSSRAIAEGRYHPTRPNEAHRRFLEWLARYLDERPELSDRSLRRALSAAQRPYRLRTLLRWRW